MKSYAEEPKKNKKRIKYDINEVKSKDINLLMQECNETSDECILKGEHWVRVESNSQIFECRN